MSKRQVSCTLFIAALLVMGCSDGRQAERDRFAAKYAQEQQRAKNMALPPPAPIVMAGDVRFGLSEPRRMEIFTAIIEAEDLGFKKALAKYPLLAMGDPGVTREKQMARFEQQTQYHNDCRHQAKANVAMRFHLTREQIDAIADEGTNEKNWPMP